MNDLEQMERSALQEAYRAEVMKLFDTFLDQSVTGGVKEAFGHYQAGLERLRSCYRKAAKEYTEIP